MICADDYGLKQDVNTAICDLIDRKKVQAVSVLIEGLILQVPNERFKLLKRREKILTGLHLDLFQNRPLYFFFELTFRPQKIQKRIRNQIALFKNILGFYPQYIDGHQHCHIYPFVGDWLLKLVSDRKEKLKFIRSVCIPNSVSELATWSQKFYLRWLHFLSKRFANKALKYQVPLSGELFGAFNQHAPIEKLYFQFKKQSSQRDSIFFVHPGFHEKQRQQDYEFLTRL